jgi:prepilin-type N-terminal cleavage/methylation domain-containing protein
MRRLGQKGMTLIELSIASAAGLLLVASVTLFFAKSRTVLAQLENDQDLVLMGQRCSENLRSTLSSSVRIFAPERVTEVGGTQYQNDDNIYYFARIRDMVDLDTSYPGLRSRNVAAFHHPPIYIGTSTTWDEPLCLTYTSSRMIGNCVAFAATMPPVSMAITVASNVERQLVDFYQFRLIYPGVDPSVKVHKNLPRQALMEWRSVPFPSYRTLDALSGERLTKTVQALVAAGYTYAWDLGGKGVNGFYSLTGTGATYLVPVSMANAVITQHQSWGEMTDTNFQLGPTTSKPFQGPMSSWGRLGGVAGGRSAYTLAYGNRSFHTTAYRAGRLLSRERLWSNMQVPEFGSVFSHGTYGDGAGFECMFTGVASARQFCALITLAARSSATAGRFGPDTYRAYRTQVTLTLRDTY